MSDYPKFNDWHVTHPLGTGKVGQSYEIERSDGFTAPERGVLKVIRIPSEEHPDAQLAQRRMLEDTAQVLRAADALSGHPNVLPWREHIIRNSETGGWEICLRAETGVPLEQYIRSHTYGERDVISMISGVCTALSLCHERGIVHGDIKPQNLFVGDAGYDGRPVLKLGDFGNAPLVPDAAGDFAAPEVLCGDEPDAQSDLYSLGMVLYWLLNDKRIPYAPPAPEPMNAANLAIARDMRLRGDPMPLPAHGSSALQSVIMTAVADRPEDRFQSADELRTALLDVVQAADERRAREERAARAAAMEAQARKQAQAREARMYHNVEEEEPEKKRTVLPIVIGSICGLIVLGLVLLLILNGIGSKKTDDDAEISYLKMSQTEVEVAPDDKVSLTCTAFGADGQEVSDADIVWSTSDQNIATVGTTGEVTGHAEGDATITAAIRDADDVDAVTCKVTVTKDAVKVEKIKLSEDNKEIAVDETLKLSYELTPAKASAGDVKWTSSDSSVATVDNDGLVKGIATGVTTIKVTVSNGENNREVSASCVIKVVEKAKVKRVTANDASVTLTGVGASKTISFTVSGKNVDEFSDRVSIRAEDPSILQVSNISRKGSGDTNTYTVTVTALSGGISSVNFVISDGDGEHTAKTSFSVDIPATPTPTQTPTDPPAPPTDEGTPPEPIQE